MQAQFSVVRLHIEYKKKKRNFGKNQVQERENKHYFDNKS